MPQESTNKLGETPHECARKLIRHSGGSDGARVVAFKQLLYYRRANQEDLVGFYGRVLSLLSGG